MSDTVSYIVTFFTHFDAMRCAQQLEQQHIRIALSPVPRKLSSSCGTCARFFYERDPLSLPLGEFEQLVREQDGEYLPVCDNR